jgi:Xaa-Pro aminopeptidase
MVEGEGEKMRPKEYRIKELLRKKGLDGAIVSSPENFHYVTGFGGHQHTVSRQPGFTLAVMRADDKVPTHLTTMDFEAATFRIKAAGLNFVVDPYDTWVGLKTWDEIAHGAVVPDKTAMESSMDKLVQFMKACDLANKKVGVELDYLPVPYYKSLTEKFPEAEFVDISDLFVYARSVKQPDEIEMFRKLCRIADHGFTEVSKIAKIGVSERELSQCFREDVIKSGFCVPSAWSMFSTGPSGARLTLPGDGVVKDGDVVKFDAGVNAEFDFYTTDTSRAWIIGNGDPALLKLKDRLYEGQRRMIAAAKPGLPINELYHTAYDYVKEMFPCYRRGHQGHSISMGPATAEAPYINASETRPLEAGMILAMEVPCYIDGVNGFNIEDMVLITEDGCEVLTPNTPHYL